jgi:hypothetical protein
VTDKDERYSYEEELVLGFALDLEPGDAVCDLIACYAPAALLIPGAALCTGCFEASKTDDGRRYKLPIGSVAFDAEVRASRRVWYETLLAELHDRDGGVRIHGASELWFLFHTLWTSGPSVSAEVIRFAASGDGAPRQPFGSKERDPAPRAA